MLTERQEMILKCIIGEYIKTATPVGSKRLQEILTIEVSSATIRNESASLEEKGFLEKEHTSSGRVPSTQGYRYYVDNLMESNKFEDAKKQIEAIFEKRNVSISEVLDKTTSILSEMTKLASVVSTSKSFDTELSLTKIELIPLSSESAAVICVLSNGIVENKVYTFDSISLEELKISINLFNERLIDTKLSEIAAKSEVIKPVLKQQVEKYEFILQSFVNTVLHTDESHSKTSGMQYLLLNPEFNDPVKIQKVVSLIENASPFAWFDMQQSCDDGRARFKIGIETGTENDDIAIVETNINAGNQKTSLALVGPKRIAYDKVSDLLNYISERIEEEFNHEKGD